MHARISWPVRYSHALAIALFTGLVTCWPHPLEAAECPKRVDPDIPPLPKQTAADSGTNIDTLKKQLKDYHAGNYLKDIAKVMEGARRHVENRVDDNKKLPPEQMKRLAIVLDIDETSLSNWDNIKGNDFGFIPGGPCFLERGLACGFNEWIDQASAPAIKPTLDFFNDVKKLDVAVFFITGRRKSQRAATMANLDRAGFEGWAALATRPDDDHQDSIVPFKAGERKKVMEERKYTNVANIGDQKSDLIDEENGERDQFSECQFKLPNPYYFIK
jgi:hypothetical protein